MPVRKVSLLFLTSVVLALGCERPEHNLAWVKGPVAGGPQYDSGPEVNALPAAVHVASIAPQRGPAAIDGAALYTQSCAACHQANGQGIPGVFPPLVNSPYLIGDNVERLAAIMIYGLVGPITVLGVEYNSAMAGLGAQYSDEQLAAVASYVRTNFGHSASPVDASVFAESRKKWGSRGPFNIQELGAES